MLKKLVVVTFFFFVAGVTIFFGIEKKNNGSVFTNLNITNIKDTIPKVALTFDDGPSSQYTEKLLDGLKERNVKATFFVMGESAKENPDIIKRMYEEGHLIGNHTYSHIDLAKTNYNDACKEINDTNTCIKNITGYIPQYIRPPYGDWNKKLLEETEMSVVLWNVDPEDWKDQYSSVVAARVMKNTRSGDIILLHDIFDSSVEAAFKIIDGLQEKGYQFVTIDRLSNKKIIRRSEEEK